MKLEQLFIKETSIDVDLGKLTLEQIMNFPSKKETGSGSFFIKKVFHANHIQIGVKSTKECGINRLRILSC